MSEKNNFDKEYKRLTEENVPTLILKLAVPTIISMLVSAVYNMADTYFVGQIGTSATAAVGVSFSLMTIIQAIGFFLGHGSGNFISRSMGEQDYKKSTDMASVGFYSSLICGGLITLIGLIFIEPMAYLFGSTDSILPYAIDYMKYILIAAPFMCASFVLNNQLRFLGKATYAMIGITSGGVLNMILDPLLIYGFDMGIAGAAVATMISQVIGFIILLIMVCKYGIKPNLKNFKFHFYYFKQIFNGGLPSLARQGCQGISTLCLNNVAGVYGDEAIAAVSIVSKIIMFAASAMIGYGQGFQPVCGVNYGAKKYDRVKKGFWFCIKSSFIVLLGFSVLGFIFAPQIIRLFRDDNNVIEIGKWVLKLQCITFPLTGYVMMTNMMAQTIGKAFKATILALSRQFIFFIPLLFILNHFFGLVGLECTQAAADLCSIILSVPICRSILKELK